MAWVKLDDQFFANPKVIDLPKDAKLLYLGGLTHAAAQLTDGTLTPGAVRMICAMVDVDRGQADALVAAGLWDRDGENFIIHDYLNYNRTAEQVKSDRDRNAQRQERYRDRHADDTNAVSNGASNGVTNEPVAPSVTAPRTHTPSVTHVEPIPSGLEPATTRAPARVRAVPKPAKVRERNPTWDALSAACGAPATRNERSDFGDTVSQLAEVEATPEQIAGFPFWWRSKYPNAPLSHRCYRDHWGRYINAPAEPPPQISDIKNPRIRAALTTDVSDIYAKHEAERAERNGLPGQMDYPRLSATTRRIGS